MSVNSWVLLLGIEVPGACEAKILLGADHRKVLFLSIGITAQILGFLSI